MKVRYSDVHYSDHNCTGHARVHNMNIGLVRYSDPQSKQKTTRFLQNCIFSQLPSGERMRNENDRLVWYCYETIMFGRVTHTLDAAVRRARSLFTSFTFHNITISCLIPKENIRCSNIHSFNTTMIMMIRYRIL